MNLVCLFVYVFLSHQKSKHHEILAPCVFWYDLKHDEARLCNFMILMALFFYFIFFIFAYTYLYHYHFCSPFHESPTVIASWNFGSRPNLDKIIFLQVLGLFSVFFRIHIPKLCVCSQFPQPSNIRAAWNLEFKQALDQLEK